MSSDQIYDPENYLLEAQQSPGLEPVKPSFDVVETPPPIASRDSSLEPSEDGEDGESGAHKRLADQEKPPQGDYVLLRQSAPGYIHVANEALKHYIGPVNGVQEVVQMTVVEDAPHDVDTRGDEQTMDDAEDNTETWAMIEGMERDAPDEAPKVNGVHSPASDSESISVAAASDADPPKASYDVKPPLRPPRIKTGAMEEESLAKSPNLARFLTNNSDGDPSNTLPAMQMSPPRSSIAGSPEPKQTLPSLSTLTTALSDAGTPFSAHSPSFTRPPPGQNSQYGPAPNSGMSPPSLSSAPSLWRTSTRESTSTPSDYAIVSANGSSSTPASSIFHPSPATSYPIPIATSPEHQVRIDGSVEQVLSPEPDGQDLNGAGEPFGSSSYKCNWDGCTAAPFQTQYLLNSHMNVHSEQRPHFCPVKNCARGPGGQGFKRKNEMIRYVFTKTYFLAHHADFARHGLVHTSPGYMCPFCPDQQHKYPRPDNLQRHVRVHHVDKDRDDPELRDVLAQRPEGGSRGRRRRLGS